MIKAQKDVNVFLQQTKRQRCCWTHISLVFSFNGEKVITINKISETRKSFLNPKVRPKCTHFNHNLSLEFYEIFQKSVVYSKAKRFQGEDSFSWILANMRHT